MSWASTAAAEQVATEVIEEMTRRYAERVPLIDGADRVVRRLAGRWPLGLASSSPTRLIAAALAATGLTGAFGATLSTEETERGKPAPDVYLAVAERLGVDPARCVAVEDSSNGVRSAAAAGMTVVAVPHGAYPLDPDAERLATLVLGTVGEADPADRGPARVGRRTGAFTDPSGTPARPAVFRTPWAVKRLGNVPGVLVSWRWSCLRRYRTGSRSPTRAVGLA